ncbi:MAG: Crp/Fnr family transcriptional regulator [Bacteroidota bacterium]
MKEKLEAFIVGRLGKTPDNLELVLDKFTPIQTKKNQVLVEMGDVCQYCYFIASGCLKISAYGLHGDESTTQLAFEQEWRTAMHSFLHQHPSNERIVAVESSELLAIHRDAFRKFSAEISGFGQIYQQLLEESYTKSVERVQTLMAMDALDRLRWLLAERPLIFTRLSNRLIASYLGMSEATLSRLKAKL